MSEQVKRVWMLTKPESSEVVLPARFSLSLVALMKRTFSSNPAAATFDPDRSVASKLRIPRRPDCFTASA